MSFLSAKINLNQPFAIPVP